MKLRPNFSFARRIASPHAAAIARVRSRRAFGRLAVTLGALVLVSALTVGVAVAQTLGRASGDFSNLRPNKSETAFGRLAADALRATGKADVALINAGALRPGTLESGDIERDDLTKLLAFGEDKVVTVTLTGAQLHAALERAASVYPTASPAFLQVAGLFATFDANAAVGARVSGIMVGGNPLQDAKTYRAAMPVSLAQGAAGYFNIWNGAQSSPTDVQMIDALGGYIRGQKEVAPDAQTRFGPA